MTPSHAYLPGLTPRHPDGCFDAIRQTVVRGMTVQTLAATPAFNLGKTWIETGFYWEAHEVLEPIWLILPEASSDRYFIQSMIQTANARLKQEMGRGAAARRIVGLARAALVSAHPVKSWGIDSAWVEDQLEKVQ